MKRQEAADYLNISIRSLQRAVQRGHLRAEYQRGKAGGMEAVFDPADVEAFKEKLASPSPRSPFQRDNAPALAQSDASQVIALLQKALERGDTPRHDVPIADKTLLKLGEASAITGLSQQVIKEAIKTESLAARKIGRAWRVKRKDLNRWVDRL